jgi:hypothetical protein
MMEIETTEQIIHIERRAEPSFLSGLAPLLTIGAIIGGWYLFNRMSKEMLIERIMRLWIRVADEKELEFDDEFMEYELRSLSLNDLGFLAEYHELIAWEKKANEKSNKTMRRRRSMEKKMERLESVKSSFDYRGIEDKIDLTAINYIIED